MECPCLEQVADPEQDLEMVERFGQEVVGARGERSSPGFGAYIGGQDQDGEVFTCGNAPGELCHDGEAIHVRHHQIEQDEIRFKFAVEVDDPSSRSTFAC
jgi:hypothetical protein